MEEKEIRDAVKDAWNGMSRFRKIRVFLKTDHFVFGQVTLMDITICTAAFLLVGFALAYRTQLQAPAIIFILLALCSVILFLRIRLRPHKNASYMYSKMLKSMKHLKKAEKEETNPEMKARIQDSIKKMETALSSMEEYIEALIEYEKGTRRED